MILAHELVHGDTPPERWMLFLHGILGRRANWRSFARSFVARRPSWGAVLVDLRDHGDSQDLPGPRTVAAAGADLISLVAALAPEHGGRVAGLLGHSFGGKVAIAGTAALREAGVALDELWVIDAPPGPRLDARDRTTEQVFETLAGLPPRFDARSSFIEAIVAAGIAKPVAQWLATNLVPVSAGFASGRGGWSFALDLERLSALLRDFAAIDLWPTLDEQAGAGTRVALVLGERSQAVFGDELARARSRAEAGTLTLASVARAAHWVHVDNPAGLLDVLG